MMRVKVTVGAQEWVFAFPLEQVRIGTRPVSNLVLAHDSVAPLHATLSREHDRLYLRSNDPQRETTVNGESVAFAQVADGDVIGIGAYRLELLDRDPPGPDEDGFLKAIALRPSDDGTRLVYSDWLEEKGRHDEAAFLRAQLEIRTLLGTGARFQELSRTIARLAPKMSGAWRRAVARPAIEGCPARFELSCPKTWDKLAPTERPNERFCGACRKNVHYATTVETARRLAVVGHCVALDITVKRWPGDLEQREVMMMGAIAPFD